jgi:hypothetical protein
VAILFETMNNIKYNIESMPRRVPLHTCRTKTCNSEVDDGNLLNHCYAKFGRTLLFLFHTSWHVTYQKKFALNYDDKS